MFRSIHKIKTLIVSAITILTPTFLPLSVNAETKNVELQVNVEEALTVSITTPTEWASDDMTTYDSATGKYVSDFLRNKVTATASTNNPIGVSLSMYTLNTELRNLASYNASDATSYIPTLQSSSAKSSFPINYWGYSVEDTDAGSDSATYNALTTTAIPLFTTVGTSNVGSGSEDVFFGTKANNEKQSGTYAQTVYFAAVTGTIVDPGTNPYIPTDPSTPVPVDEVASYDSNAGVSGGSVIGSTGQTTYTNRATSTPAGSTVSYDTTSSQVTGGDVTANYAQVAGVTTSRDGNNGLAIALATSAGVTAASGIFFFILAKRRKDDDEEEE